MKKGQIHRQSVLTSNCFSRSCSQDKHLNVSILIYHVLTNGKVNVGRIVVLEDGTSCDVIAI